MTTLNSIDEEQVSAKPIDAELENIRAMFYELDDHDWTLQINEKNFNQQRCFPPTSDIIMSKVRTVVKAPLDICIKCGCDFEVRKEWDNVLYDLRTFEESKDKTYMRCAYSFGSPFPAADRDFYLQ